MKRKLLIVYLFFVCISASFGQSTSKSKIPGVDREKKSQHKICNLGQEIRNGTFPKPGVLKTSNGQSRSNPVMRPQAKTAIPSSSFPGARTAATYTNIYNGVEYSSDHPYNLTVIYFVPNDVPLDLTYQSRVSAYMLHTQDWYKQQMVSNGYGAKTFGLFTETANPGNVEIVVVNGVQGASAYNSGAVNVLQAEVDIYLSNNPLLKTSEHIFVLTAGTDITANVPFFGLGTNAYAVDFPELDMQNLADDGVYSPIKWKYGGLVHELGHGLNLRHSHPTSTEYADPLRGMNIMSVGNYTLNISPTFLNRAGAAILNVNQVFAETSGTYYNGHSTAFTSLSAVFDNGDIVISGSFASDKTVTDVNFFQDATGSNSGDESYYRVAWSVSPVGNTFSVRMPVSELAVLTQSPFAHLPGAEGPFHMDIELVLENGEIEKYRRPYTYDNGIPDLSTISLAPLLMPAPALCASVSPNQVIFSENFESGLGAFTTSHETPSASWEVRNWVQSSAPGGRAGKVAFGADYLGGDCIGSNQAGIIRMQSPIISIPAGIRGNLNMAFYRYIDSEDIWDGGNIKYSINGGAWTLLPASAFTANGYNKSLETADNGNTNPLEGQPAFTGLNENEDYRKSWGQSQIDLTSIGLVAGDDIQLRWEMGTDGCTGIDGWYIDDIAIYSCGTLPVTLVKFEGKHSAEGNLLTWTTTAEVNNEYFAVEKSMSGLNFKEISRIAGSGNSSVMNTYKFTDSDFQKGISYYRLKQVDTDGTYAYSRIISVDGPDLQDLKFFPNPVESLLTIELPDADMKAADVKVFNLVGQQVLVSRQMTAINGQLHLDLGKLPTGIYQVIMTNGNRVKSISVLKL